ncbi:hypothetical protein [Mucilaginibacter sp.]|uniref:hypothetical protein n=1 Tax=Mucilaginibacter sp. TaxID=1882438 RepID=UPI0032630C35
MDYTLNGYDLKEMFGLVISNGSDTFLAYPKRKDSLQNNWPEQDGIDKDLTDPHFEARDFKLSCALIAEGREDFKTRYDALFTLLSGQGSKELYIADIDRAYHVYYKEQVNLTKLTQLNRESCGVKFDLVFAETNPFDNIPAVYLVDDQDRFLSA